MLRTLGLVVGCLALFGTAQAGPIEGSPPYPASKVITNITFDWSTYKHTVPGSDNWPLTALGTMDDGGLSERMGAAGPSGECLLLELRTGLVQR